MPDTNKDYSHRLERRGFLRQVDLEKKATVRPIITRGRQLEQQNWEQLPLKSNNTLTSVTGAFYFVIGFSKVDGTDLVRPE